jgi:hypothetical protein
MLLVPADLDRYLTPAQLEAVLAHEWCHVRRRAHPIDGTPDRADDHDGAAGATRIAAGAHHRAEELHRQRSNRTADA